MRILDYYPKSEYVQRIQDSIIILVEDELEGDEESLNLIKKEIKGY